MEQVRLVELIVLPIFVPIFVFTVRLLIVPILVYMVRLILLLRRFPPHPPR